MILLVCPFVCAARPAAHSLSVGATLLIKTPIFSHLFAAYYLIARLTSSVSSASPTILSFEVPQLELIDSRRDYDFANQCSKSRTCGGLGAACRNGKRVGST